MSSIPRKVMRSLLCILLVGSIFGTLVSGLYAGTKIPLVKKKKAHIRGEQTFVGKIKSIDTKERVLVLTTTEGDQEESFDYKRSVRITSAHKQGGLKVSDLTVGMLVTLYIKSSKSSSEIYEILIM